MLNRILSFLKRLSRTVKTVLGLVLILACFILYMQRPLFHEPYSTSVYASDGSLLGARIAADGQWRFEPGDSVPEKFELCLRYFEDEYFYWHPGVNPISLGRAMIHNLRARRIVSGGSTITMQVVRLSGQNRRNIWNKLLESIMAVGLELTRSKQEILSLYTAHAPFGGNVVGLEAASWRYFGRPPHQLSWSESAALAVLPNSPALIHPGRNRQALFLKRNRLLAKLYQKKIIDEVEYRLALDEPLPDETNPLPALAPHLLDRLAKQSPGERIFTTIDYHLQQRTNAVVSNFHGIYRQGEIHNLAAIVLDTQTGDVLAYVGNTPGHSADKGHQVDVVMARRSTGSLLKPFLYLAALRDGLILPQMLLPDIPTYYSDYRPENYSHTFDGAVPAGQALSRSLNVPAVRLLNDFGTDKMVQFLRQMGLSEIDKPASHYGLSLMLGGAESSLWSLTGAYASMARILAGYDRHAEQVSLKDIHPPVLTEPDRVSSDGRPCHFVDMASLWHIMEALADVKRPEEEAGWEQFSGGRKVAWKTGTSFGFRDAWAIGTTPRYTVGVWVGNATGEGRPGIVGGQVAAPVMFELFRLLPSSAWFQTPHDAMVPVPVCRQSGYRAGSDCPDVDTLYAGPSAVEAPVCKYHSLVNLSADGLFRVNSACYPVGQMVQKSWFVLPPVYEWYFKSRNPWYQPLPPLMDGCSDDRDRPIGMVYPEANARIFLPVGIDGKPQPLVATATHRQFNVVLYWYLDDVYVGATQGIHQQELSPTMGQHVITVVDQAGQRLALFFECVGRGDQ